MDNARIMVRTASAALTADGCRERWANDTLLSHTQANKWRLRGTELLLSVPVRPGQGRSELLHLVASCGRQWLTPPPRLMQDLIAALNSSWPESFTDRAYYCLWWVTRVNHCDILLVTCDK